MSSPEGRRGFLGLALGGGALALSGCGFTPLYSEAAPASLLRGLIRVEPSPGREGFTIRETLLSRLGVPVAPAFSLSTSFTAREEGLAITQTADITRYNVTGTLDYRLYRLDSLETVVEGSLRSTAGYSATGSAYAATVAERDARERLARTLAERLATRILLEATHASDPA